MFAVAGAAENSSGGFDVCVCVSARIGTSGFTFAENIAIKKNVTIVVLRIIPAILVSVGWGFSNLEFPDISFRAGFLWKSSPESEYRRQESGWPRGRFPLTCPRGFIDSQSGGAESEMVILISLKSLTACRRFSNKPVGNCR
jgi:hypothetical protein